MYSPVTDDFTQRLEQHILDNVASFELDNAILARHLYMSEASFYRLVKKHYGISPNTLVRRMRLRLAGQLLKENPSLTVRDVAFSVGFSHVGYFIRRFEEHYQLTPGEFQRRHTA